MFVSEINKNKIINLLFLFLPVSFICGNLVININVIFLIITSLIFFYPRVMKFDNNIYDKLLLLFFFIVLFSGIFNSYFYYFPEKSIYAKELLIKSFLYLRFALLYLIIKFLIKNDILKLKYFFISASICSLFVAFDVVLQFATGKDIFGYESFDRRNPGPFGDEAISGSYLQRFSIFLFFLIPIFFKKYDNSKNLIIVIILFLVTFSAILFSGNKFPFFMFILSVLTLILLLVRSKKMIIFLLLICPTIFIIFFKYNSEVKNNFTSFFTRFAQIKIYTSSVIENVKSGSEIVIPNTWIKEMHNGILAFNNKKVWGGGLKSYKISCPKVSKYSCNQHPHNYHIEILLSSGIIGYLSLLIIFFHFFYKVFIKNYYAYSRYEQLLLVLFFTLFFIESFPLKTSGSFFSTANATYFFIIMSITISLGLKKKNK